MKTLKEIFAQRELDAILVASPKDLATSVKEGWLTKSVVDEILMEYNKFELLISFNQQLSS